MRVDAISGRAMGILVSLVLKAANSLAALSRSSGRSKKEYIRSRLLAATELPDGSAPS